MSQDQIDILKRALEREKQARKAAEKILEEKSRELYQTSQKLELLLDEKSSQLQGVFENIVDAYVVMDLNGDVLKFNEAAARLFGYDIEQEPVNVIKLIYKEDYEYAMVSYMELQSKGFFKDYEARVYTKSGEVKWVHINASIVYNRDKTPIAAQGIVRDITEQKIAAESLLRSESRLASLIVNLDSAVLLEDENRKIVLTNKKFCDVFNIPVDPDQLKGQDCSGAAEQSKTLFEDEDNFVNRINEVLEKRQTVLGDELVMKNGKILERDFVPIIKDGIYRGHLWTYRDITLQKNYSESLEKQKQKYSSIIANMNLGLVEVNNDDEILMVNQSFLEISGYTEEELIGKKGGKLFSIDDGKTISEENLKRQKGESNSYELKVKNKHGDVRYWLISGAPNYNLNGEVIGSIGIHLDITDLKSLEYQKEKLLQKLEKSNDELQEYAHIVSHDLKSPLRSIDALVSWLREDNKEKLDAASLQNLDLIQTTLEKMEQLISDVLNYSSVSADNSENAEVDIESLVADLLKILYIPEHINVTIHNVLPKVMGDQIKLQQVFQNLISNAVKFNDKDNGLIEIDVADEGKYYRFSIKDNGIGIEPQFHDKVFKIFHSLKKSKDSSGIGLSIVKKIVNLHQGKIWLESELGSGTIFYFTLKK
ncbi:PAS domain-containing sensor histidine kinase [Winogradskyella flava]|uniref:histidine kinase n=1 Tax=Winogradskyella flava TaxID=1884876 RepID=A0A842IR70_9FLAO|nr:PAS domain S-box protein [Winogradskyella flava]MBC2844234.1 PAS domain S-box protein [Winogradskyella flava]